MILFEVMEEGVCACLCQLRYYTAGRHAARFCTPQFNVIMSQGNMFFPRENVSLV